MGNDDQQLIYRGCTPVVDTKYNFEGDRPATEAVIDALSEATDVDPLNRQPLYEFIDPQVLDDLFNNSDKATDAQILLSFHVERWKVFVRSGGRICICDTTQPTDPQPIFEPATD